MPTCEIALRCTDPEGEAGKCEFYEAAKLGPEGWHGYLLCKHLETPAAFCGHRDARRAAFRAMVHEAMGIGVTDATVPPPPVPPRSHLIRETDVKEKP